VETLIGVQTEIESNILPQEFALDQNYPNPFNPSTTIKYQLSKASYVSLKVYDVLGREVITLVDEYKQAGFYNSKFSLNGSQASSGIYFAQLRSDNTVQTIKMMLLK
ncbi:MAG: T9SS type A sorting domain-containing protein, partial [Ignavibacteria bacterium]|nr:T9SS type A sorting domain-containing protein [Ignavibacteria bacterium]